MKRVIDGSLELAGKAGEGKLNVKYTTTPLASDTALTVLDTDYDSYAVIWSCNGFGPLHARNSCIFLRKRDLNYNVFQRVLG